MPTKPYFFDYTPDALARLFNQWGLARFRGRQVVEWVYKKGVNDPLKMSNLSQDDRELLADKMSFSAGEIIHHQKATDGTQKLLLDWENGAIDGGGGQTECVMIPAEGAKPRRTACISSQVGCPVGCKFCASGLGGLEGNLSSGQIVEQVWRLAQLENVRRISNVVFMGMGEPLANFDAVTGAIKTLMADWGMGISARHITVSTVGLPAQIRRLAELNLSVTLAISLHAPNDELRKQLIPWAKHVTIDKLIEAGNVYFQKTGREVTLEYILLKDVNDRIQHAEELAQVARRIRANVNLIRYNEVSPLPFNRPQNDDVHKFQTVLKQAGINTHIRASRGRDIAAACGQLRHEAKEN